MSPSSSAPPTATSTPTVDLRASLEKALHSYFDALYAAGLDPAGKTDALAELIDPKCACRRTVEVLREQAKRGRYVDYRYTLSEIDVIDVDERDGVVHYTVAQSTGALREASGEVIERYPPSRERYSARFASAPSGWLLHRVELLK